MSVILILHIYIIHISSQPRVRFRINLSRGESSRTKKEDILVLDLYNLFYVSAAHSEYLTFLNKHIQVFTGYFSKSTKRIDYSNLCNLFDFTSEIFIFRSKPGFQRVEDELKRKYYFMTLEFFYFSSFKISEVVAAHWLRSKNSLN